MEKAFRESNRSKHEKMKKFPIVAAVLLVIVFSFMIYLTRKPVKKLPYTFTRDWLRKGNIWVFDQPPPEYLEALRATGTAFSVYYSGFNEYEWNYVKSLHHRGFKATANLPLGQATITENIELRENVCKRNIHNQPILLLGLEGIYNACGNNPLWRDFLMKRIAELAQGDVDGILLDEPGDIGDCFCDHCMRAFNNYLAEHYTSEELQRFFGITDLSSFSYREYLLRNGGTQWWDDPNPNLQMAYLKFRYSERVNFIRNLIRQAKEAAGWDIPVTANVYEFSPNHQIFVPLLDFVIYEMPIIPEAHPDVSYLRSTPGKHFVTYLLAEALDPEKPFSAFPDVFDLLHLSRDLENEQWLWRYWLAEARACGASFMIPYKAYVYGEESDYTLDVEEVSPYTKFFAENPEYYENLERIATVGLLFDLHSTLFNKFTWLTYNAWSSFENIGITLQEAHVPFEIIYRGDGVFVQKSCSLSELRRYRAIIIPKDYDLDQDFLNILQQYSASGGIVIRRDNLADDSQIVSELRRLGIDLGVETNATDALSLIIYRRGDSLLIHMINSRYDLQARDFSSLTNVEITLTIPDGVTLDGKLLRVVSPDSDNITLGFVIQDGKVKFTLPYLHCYSVAFFE